MAHKEKKSTVKGGASPSPPPGWASGPRKSRIFGEGSSYSDGSDGVGGGSIAGSGGVVDRRESIAKGVDRIKLLEGKVSLLLLVMVIKKFA